MKHTPKLSNFRKTGSEANINSLVDSLREVVNTNAFATSANAKNMLSLESISDFNQRQTLDDAFEQLAISVESVAASLNMADDKGELTYAQQSAAAIAGIMAGDWRSALLQDTKFNAVSTENLSVVQPFGVADAVAERSFALEAYDERENRNATIYSIAYNMQAARQDEFGETFFPTLVTTPDNVGFGITINLMMVYDGIEHKVTGTFEDFKKKNIIRAVADSTVLRKEQTKVIPVHRPQSADKFVASAVIPAYTTTLEGEAIDTAPLKVGVKSNLIALSQTDTLLAGGTMDMTDSLDPYITLQNVYAVVGDDTLKFHTLNLPLANFTYSTQDNYRVMNLNFHTTSVLVNKTTKNLDGSNLVTLAPVVTNDLIVRLEVMMTGRINIETGECQLFANNIGVHTVQNADGALLDLASAPASTIVGLVAGATIEGYDLQAYRTNMNRRQRGQLVDVTRTTQLYNVPLRSPITTIHPIQTDGQTDASDVQALITTTRIRTSNEAVTALLNSAQTMREYVDARDVTGVGPEVLGVARYLVRPTFFEHAVDLNEVVDSLTSTARPQDIQNALTNVIRDFTYRMYRDSEYPAAANAMAGGIAPTPSVIIGTDPVLARYLQITGDLRLAGSEFEVRVVNTLDNRVKDKIFITFGVFDESRNTTPNALNFGNMIWGPELVLTANISRGNTISRETVVQPRYLFVNHLPIMTVLTVSNVPDVVLEKMPVNTHAVP